MEHKVDSTLLDKANKAGSADEILMDVLGVPSTIPQWARTKIDAIVDEFSKGAVHAGFRYAAQDKDERPRDGAPVPGGVGDRRGGQALIRLHKGPPPDILVNKAAEWMKEYNDIPLSRWFPRVRSLRDRPWALGYNSFGVNTQRRCLRQLF